MTKNDTYPHSLNDGINILAHISSSIVMESPKLSESLGILTIDISVIVGILLSAEPDSSKKVMLNSQEIQFKFTSYQANGNYLICMSVPCG